ncbi:MAG: hypothetical protein QOG30_2309 [Acidimicrobiaceae bacterium]
MVCLVLALAGGGWAYVVGSRPGNENFVAKSADWFRDHHLNGVANWVERQWYSHHAPPVGGDPSRSITAGTIATEQGGSSGGGVTLPPTVQSPASPALPNEGVWQALVSTSDGHTAVAEAQIRPDAIHTSVLGALVWIDPTRVQLLEVPGTVEPGGKWPVAGTIPTDLRPRLIGAFNGGFRFKDSAGGYFSAGQAAPALVDGTASLVIRKDGTVDVGQWGRDDVMGPNIASVRQNLPLIIDGGQPVPGIDDNTNNRWGDTLGSRVFVWRSAVGVRADGTLVYAASDGLTAVSLADMMVRAGVVRAMELDINPNWVTFNLFSHPNPSDPSATTGAKLLPDMHRTSERYLGPDSRDFTAILLRN